VSETTQTAEGAGAEPTLASVHHEADSHAADATLPDAGLEIDEAEWRALVADFRAVRDGHRGRFAADARDLPADPVRVATALAKAAEAAPPADRRGFLEDLVDLQAFVPDPPAALAPAAPGAGSDPEADELLERIRWRQAVVTTVMLGHASILGDHNAIGARWTPIGDARSAIDLVNDYREEQTAAFGAMAFYPVAALIGFGVAIVTGLGRPSIVGLVALGLGWIAAAWIGIRAGAFEAWVVRQPWRGSRLASVLEVTVGLGALFVLPFVYGALVAIVGLRLGPP
jgi:hypothetical protein